MISTKTIETAMRKLLDDPETPDGLIISMAQSSTMFAIIEAATQVIMERAEKGDKTLHDIVQASILTLAAQFFKVGYDQGKRESLM
jgi:hypothetical protein